MAHLSDFELSAKIYFVISEKFEGAFSGLIPEVQLLVTLQSNLAHHTLKRIDGIT